MFLGAEMKDTLWSFWAKNLESSKYGITWPFASQGNIAIWSFSSLAIFMCK